MDPTEWLSTPLVMADEIEEDLERLLEEEEEKPKKVPMKRKTKNKSEDVVEIADPAFGEEVDLDFLEEAGSEEEGKTRSKRPLKQGKTKKSGAAEIEEDDLEFLAGTPDGFEEEDKKGKKKATKNKSKSSLDKDNVQPAKTGAKKRGRPSKESK